MSPTRTVNHKVLRLKNHDASSGRALWEITSEGTLEQCYEFVKHGGRGRHSRNSRRFRVVNPAGEVIMDSAGRFEAGERWP